MTYHDLGSGSSTLPTHNPLSAGHTSPPPQHTRPRGPTRPNKLHIILSTHHSFPETKTSRTAVSLRCIPEVSHSNPGTHKLNGVMYHACVSTKRQSIYIAMLCAMACCNPVGEYRRFDGIYRCYLQGYVLNYEHLWRREPTGALGSKAISTYLKNQVKNNK
jgi:hypothetical protein